MIAHKSISAHSSQCVASSAAPRLKGPQPCSDMQPWAASGFTKTICPPAKVSAVPILCCTAGRDALATPKMRSGRMAHWGLSRASGTDFATAKQRISRSTTKARKRHANARRNRAGFTGPIAAADVASGIFHHHEGKVVAVAMPVTARWAIVPLAAATVDAAAANRNTEIRKTHLHLNKRRTS